MTSFDVTHSILYLGRRNYTSGWPTAYYHTESDADGDTVPETMIFVPKTSQYSLTGLGTYVRGDALGLTLAPVNEGDKYTINLKRYLVTAVRDVMHLGGDSLSRREVDLEELRFEDLLGETYTDSSLQDARYRTKVYLESYLAHASLPKFLVAIGEPSYPLPLLFKNRGYDVVFRIGEPTVEFMFDAWHVPYATKELVPIHVECVDKSNMNGDKLKWQAETELRRIVAAYPIPSSDVTSRFVRMLSGSRGGNRHVGSTQLYSTTVTLEYTRVDPDYSPSYPSFSHGMGFTYEGDRTSDGNEGTWTLTQGGGSTCAQSVTTDKNLYLNQTVFGADSYTKNGTNLSLSTTVYTTIRWRYKTSGNSTAKIVLEFSDASTQTVLSETASSTFTVGTTTITTGKTLDHISLYNCDGVGTVTYDFVQVYSGTYTIPNVVSMEPPFMVNDVEIVIPGRSGDMTNAQGTSCLEVVMECDTDMQPDSLTWKRPQTDTTKTDVNNTDILYEMQHLGGANAQNIWTWLDLGNPAMQFKARLKSIEPSYMGEAGRVRLTWREYRHGSAAWETTSERFGLSL